MAPAKKRTSRKRPAKAAARAAKPRLLSGDNPQIPKGEGDEPAEIYVTYLVTAGADPRKDAEAPDNCKLPS